MKTSWFVWNWRVGAIHKSDCQFNNIIVSTKWIENNINAEGNVVAGPFTVLTNAIAKCDELNGNVI